MLGQALLGGLGHCTPRPPLHARPAPWVKGKGDGARQGDDEGGNVAAGHVDMAAGSPLVVMAPNGMLFN